MKPAGRGRSLAGQPGWPGRQEAALHSADLAIATAALFALTRNFWLCLACQVLAETAMALWWGEEQRTATG